MPTANRFTIYDVLEKKGYFSSNPANNYARDPVDGKSLFKGPQAYPKMLYHPKGQERITAPGEMIQTPFGPKHVGEQREIIYRIVETEEEDTAARAEGWHDHPSKAIKARIEKMIKDDPDMQEEEKALLLKSVPLVSSDARIQELEAEIARLTGVRDAEKAQRGESSSPVPTNKSTAAKTSVAAE